VAVVGAPEQGAPGYGAPRPTAPVLVLADGRDGAGPSRGPVARATARFAAGTALALGLLVVVAVLLAQRAAEQEGFADARRVTEVVAHTVIEPNLTAGVVMGDRAALRDLDALITEHVLHHTGILRVKLWTAQGRIVYSDERRLDGQQYVLEEEEEQVLRDGGVASDISELGRAENRFEGDLAPRLVETYLGVRAKDGQRLLFEAYYSYDVVAAQRWALLRSVALLTLAALLIFSAVQVWLGWRGVLWIQAERERLVQRGEEVSRHERLRVASDLHDGALQDFVGASYVVAGAVSPVRSLGGDDIAQGLRSAAASIRTGVQSLRSTLVDIYPESLRNAGLRAALSDLVAPLRAKGVGIDIDVPDDLVLGQELEQEVYRAAQEAVRNVGRHARARTLALRVQRRAGEVELLVVDDGVGFDAAAGAPAGHLGLASLADRTAAAGGLLELRTASGLGTTLRLVLPA
jgi:two-component system, NarL family, sensor kinase